MFYSDQQPFSGRNRGIIAGEIVYATKLWFQDTSRGKGKLLGGEENAGAVVEILRLLLSTGGLDVQKLGDCESLINGIERAFT